MSYNGSTPASHAGSVGSIPITRLIKRLVVWFFVGLLILSTLLACLDPSYVKDIISQRITAYTGREILIKGPIIWHLTPHLGVEFYDVQMANAPTFQKEFISFKKASIHSAWKSLCAGSLKPVIQVEGLELKLERNIFGHGNWEDLNKALRNHPFLYKLLFSASTLHVYNSHIFWTDKIHHQNMHFQDLDIHAPSLEAHYGGMEGFYRPLNLHFYWKDLNHTKVGMHIKLETELRTQIKRNQMDFKNILITAAIAEQPTTTIHADLQLKHLKSTPQIQATIQAMNIPLDYFLKEYGWDLAGSSQNVHLKTAIDYRSPNLEIPTFMLSFGDRGLLEGSLQGQLPEDPIAWTHMAASGSFNAKDLQIAALDIDRLQTSFEAKKGILHFEKLDALTTGIEHHGWMEMDLRTNTPRFSLGMQSEALDLNESLLSWQKKNKISGQMKASSELWTEGHTLSACLHNMEGQTSIQIKNGKIYGISLMPLLEQAQGTLNTISDRVLRKQPVNIEALLTAELGEWKQQALDSENLYTPFDYFETDLSISQGKINTKHFSLYHPGYKVYGKGLTDLRLKKSDYETFALLNTSASRHKGLRAFLEKTPLSIQIKGPLDNLMIRPELGSYAQNAVQALYPQAIPSKTPMSTPLEPKEPEMEKLFVAP